jgi:hypothetical protein
MNTGGVRWKLLAEAFRAWIPIVISVCAISLTIFQAMSTRRHTRLSVQPRVDWRIEEEAASGTIALSLVNVGFGPAIISELAYVIDGERIPAVDLDACVEVSRRIGRDDPARWDTSCIASDSEYVLRAGDSVVLFGSRPTPPHAAADHSAALVDYRRFAASGRYCSFYEDCWDIRLR